MRFKNEKNKAKAEQTLEYDPYYSLRACNAKQATVRLSEMHSPHFSFFFASIIHYQLLSLSLSILGGLCNPKRDLLRSRLFSSCPSISRAVSSSANRIMGSHFAVTKVQSDGEDTGRLVICVPLVYGGLRARRIHYRVTKSNRLQKRLVSLIKISVQTLLLLLQLWDHSSLWGRWWYRCTLALMPSSISMR